jgi:biopolymer transport protein ExbD
MARPLAFLKPERRWAQFSLATVFIIMTTICVLLGVWVSRTHRQRDAVLLKVVIHASKSTSHAEVVKVINALTDVKVAKIEADVSLQPTPGVSATIQARSDTPYNAVARTLEALQSAGVRKTTLTTTP